MDSTHEKVTLVQVMVKCRQAANHVDQDVSRHMSLLASNEIEEICVRSKVVQI